ncbi:MAG: hypothetical protein U0936_25310 [Planctomycetaceae bacterium]
MWTTDEVATTKSGLHYPVKFGWRNGETAGAPFQGITITRFQERTNFEPHEFQFHRPWRRHRRLSQWARLAR